MIKKDKIKNSKGQIKTQIRVVESYRPGHKMNPKQRTIKDFGYLEDQADPEAFMESVQEFNANYKKENVPLRIEVAGTAKMYGAENRKQNYGYKYLEAVYERLGIEGFIAGQMEQNGFQGDYSPSQIFKFLVLLRILKPDSKRATFQMKENFYGMETGFALQDVYRALSQYARWEVELQRHLNEAVKAKIGRDMSHTFYDVTNYFFEIDFPDGEDDLRQNGVSKEHRVDPIASMGLFMDNNGLPVSMSIFPGNTSESLTLKPTLGAIKKTYGLGRLTVVADKGLNSSSNIDDLVNDGDGFVFSQVLKGTKGKRYHEKLFDETGCEEGTSLPPWIINESQTYKYKLFTEEYTGKDKDGHIVVRKRKVLLYWDKADADMDKRKRAIKLQKAARSVKNNAYSIKKGVDAYTKDNIVDKETGEILQNTVTKRSVDLEKAEKDARYDGFYCIITSEMDYDAPKIRQVYGGLWKIEQSFRLLKSDLYARPVFVRKNEHIRAHFLICFTALLIVRIIQLRMAEHTLSAERIARALSAANCHILKGGIIHLDDVGGAVAFKKRIDKHGNLVDTLGYTCDDEIAMDYKKIQNLFGTDSYTIYQRQEFFNTFLNSIVI